MTLIIKQASARPDGRISIKYWHKFQIVS